MNSWEQLYFAARARWEPVLAGTPQPEVSTVQGMKLLNTQKVTLYNAIAKMEFAPEMFELDDPAEDNAPTTLTVKGTLYRFEIGFSPGNGFTKNSWKIHRIPGSQKWDETYYPAIFHHLVESFSNWLSSVKTEINTADPWLRLKQTPIPALGITGDTLNTPFTFPEWERVANGLDQIGNMLAGVAKLPEQMKLIEDGIRKLKEDGKHVGRKDWLLVAIGTLVSFFVALATPPNLQETIWNVLKAAITGAVHLLPG